MDETSIKVKAQWMYLYRAVDSCGHTIEFLLSVKRDAEAARRLFRKELAQPHTVNPRTITVDKNAGLLKSRHRHEEGPRTLAPFTVATSKYLNNIVEQDLRQVKRLTGPGLGFDGFWMAR